MKQILIAAIAIITVFASCTKEIVTAPSFSFSENKDTIDAVIKQSTTIEALQKSASETQVQWMMNDSVISTEHTFQYKFETAGFYTINFRAKNTAGIFEKMFVINVEPNIITGGSNKFVTQLFEYRPAPGQFINKAPGNLASAENILAKNSSMVTLGAWGGYIVLGFDHTVLNKEENDILIAGNAYANFAEPSIVYVMRDDNGNSKPDDTWYELTGSEFGKETYKRNYSVTYYKPAASSENVKWTDNEGKSGFVLKNNFHSQNYYPAWEGDSYTISGSWLKGNIDNSISNNIKSFSYAWGYADNTVGGDKFDISNAIDANGKSIKLKGIDFIKIQTAVMADMGWLGELSTEIKSVEDLHFGN